MVYGLWYSMNIGVIRCSVLFLIRRIFGEASLVMRRISTAGIIFTTLFTITQIIVFASQCNTPKATFNIDIRRHASCSKALADVQVLTWINIGSDTFILFLPVYSIWTLNLPLTQRLRIMCLFWLGVVTFATGVLRYLSYEQVYKTNDLGCKTQILTRFLFQWLLIKY